jgi:hypothetical protein
MGLFDNMDPDKRTALAMALLNAGASMTQPTRYPQNFLSNLTRGMAVGGNTYMGTMRNSIEDRLAQERMNELKQNNLSLQQEREQRAEAIRQQMADRQEAARQRALDMAALEGIPKSRGVDMPDPTKPLYGDALPQSVNDLSAYGAGTPTPEPIGYGTSTQQVPLSPTEQLMEMLKISVSRPNLAPHVKQVADAYKTLNPPEEAYTLGEGQNRYKGSSIIAQGQPKTKTERPVNMPNWYDAVGATFFPDYATNPASQAAWNARFTAMMGNDKGRAELLTLAQRIAQSTTPTSVTYLQTNEGFVPATTRGPGAGSIGQPSGSHKPMTGEMVTSEQQLGTLKDTLDRAKTLYNPSWVGPIAGRLGGIQEKTIGIDPQRSSFLAQNTQMSNTLIYLMSGKQINESEYIRLKKQLPDVDLPPKNYEARVAEFERTLESIIENRHKNMGAWGVGNGSSVGSGGSQLPQEGQRVVIDEGQGTGTLKELQTRPEGQKLLSNQAPLKVGEVKKGYRYKGGDPSIKSNWEKVS